MAAVDMIVVGWILGSVLTVSMLMFIWWALFADRSRGERRCPRCWHHVDAAVGLRCPECGHAANSEADLLRTRRRWGVAAAALLALLTGTLWLRGRLSSDGWWTLVPPRTSLALMPWLPSQEHLVRVRGHLADELEAGRLSSEDELRMIALLGSADTSPAPGSDAWRATYVRWLWLLKRRHGGPGGMSQEAIRTATTGLPPVVSFRPPAGWWAGEPLVGMLAVEDWWPAGADAEFRVEEVSGIPLTPEAATRLKSSRWVRRGWNPGDGPRDAFAIDLGPLPAGEHRGELRIAWRVLDRTDGGVGRADGQRSLPLRIRVAEAAPSLEAAVDPEVDRIVREVFAAGLLRRESTPPQFAFTYAPFETSGAALEDMLFGLVVEACEGGIPRRTLRVWWRGGIQRSPLGWESPTEDLEALQGVGDGTGWTMRVRGDEELARRAADRDADVPATRWWQGSVEMPLSVRSVPEARSAAGWRLVPDPTAEPEAGPR